MMKSKLQDSNAMAESTDISPKSAQKEDAKAGADHGAPRTVPRMCAAEEGQMGPEEARDRASAARTYDDSDMSASTSDSQNEDPDELTLKGAALGAPRKTPKIRTAEEGRMCLEDAQLIEPGEALDFNILAGALIQISLFPGMLQAMRDSVHAVALLMAKAAPADVGEDTIGGIVDHVVDKLSDAVKAATQAAIAEIKSVYTVLTESSTQMAATATSYRDVLKSTATGQAVMTPSLDARVRVREGIKARQVLVDVLTPDQQLHRSTSNT